SVDIEVFFDDLPETPGIVVCAVGLLGDQQEAEQNPEMAQLIVDSNFTGPMVVLEAVAVRLAALDHDTAIIAISSVAGDRGRAKNYWYGAAKAGFTAGLSGLRQRYVRSRLHVMTVKPGFVATRMTAGMDMPASLTGQPDEIATLVYRGLARKKYVVCPPIWRLVMLVLRSLPEAIFMKTKI
ncbi:MAG: decaprenylphospho-beta-D-erythro-pentofuranosid-2-ulose 2-reductase, partial [Alphaproteobacteria bacterium]